MIAALLLAIQTAIVPPTVTVQSAPSPLSPPALADWASLPVFPLPRTAVLPDGSVYVRAEVEAGRCQPIVPSPPDGVHVIAPVAILVGTNGMIRRIVPKAIGCPTVEQFTVGYLLSLTRGGPGAMLPPAPGWYQLSVTYRW